MKVLFVGLGSIAKRHIKNLKDLYLDIQIDILRHEEGCCQDGFVSKYIDCSYSSVQEIEQYDAVFITNPTSMHYGTLKDLINNSKNFFIEKPVFENCNKDINALGLKEDGIYYVACPLRYTNVIQYIKENIEFDKVYSMRVIASSYLPDWRPGKDYRNTYSAKKSLGGGVSIDLIHEWDYICYLLGGIPKSIYSIRSRKSGLDIDSDDIAVYIAEYDSVVVELHLDYFGRVPIRKIELFCEDDVVEADLIEQKIIYRKNNKVINLYEDRDAYQKRELKHYFDIVFGKEGNDNEIEKACVTLRLACNIV